MRLKNLKLYIIFGLLLFIPLQAGAGTRALFWAPLTPFETKVLNNVKAARAGKAEALLALALVASGDVRHQKSFNTIQKQVHHFIKQIRPTIEKQPSVFAKGEKLLKAMHRHYFAAGPNGGGSELIDGYDADQSQLSVIFQNGRFNCISSAMLYIILARYFELDARGVVTTQHAFVQINAPKGRKIEVETTSKSGYGLVHDKKFYERRFAAFSRSRNLAMPTYDDYLNRQVLSPFMLIVENMNHQHTLAERMDEATRHRLFEIQGYLDSNTAASQVNRLSIYQNSLIKLLNQRDSRQAEALMRVIEPVVRQIKSRSWIRDTRDKDVQAIWKRLGAIHTLQGHWLLADKQYDSANRQYAAALKWATTPKRRSEAQKGIHKAKAFEAFTKQQWQQAIAAYQSLLTHANGSDKELKRQTRENIAAAYWNWGNAAAGRSDWQQAAVHYGAIEQWTAKTPTRKTARALQVNATAMHHYKGKRWEKAIHYFEEALALQKRSQQTRTRHNIGSAYINWGNTLLRRKRYWQALDKYEAALGMIEKGKKAMVYQNVMAVYQRLTAPLIKQNQIEQAIDMIHSSNKRFPGCAPCRKEMTRLARLAKAQKKR